MSTLADRPVTTRYDDDTLLQAGDLLLDAMPPEAIAELGQSVRIYREVSEAMARHHVAGMDLILRASQ